MAGSIKGITVEIGGDTTKLDKALSETNKNSRSLQTELKQVEKLLKLDPNNTELVAQKQKLLKDAIGETKNKLDTLKIAEQQVQQQFENGEVSEEQYRALQREIVSTEQQLKELESAARDSNESLDKIGETVGKVGQKSTELGEKLLPVSAAAAAMGVAAIASTIALDDGYDTIITKTGATGEALEGLTTVADNVFTNMPTDMDTVGEAVGEINTRFGSTGDELEGLTTKFIKFSEINDSDVTTSIANVNKIMEAWNVDSSQTGDLLGMITAKSQETGISVDTLMESVLTNNSTFKEMGLTLEQSINLMANFEENGVNSTTAIAGLKKAVANYTAQGLSMDEALGATIDSIKNATSETDALSIATEIFGAKGAAEMTNAIREGRISIDDLSGSMGDYGTAVEDTFEATQDPWDEATIALNNIKLAGAQLGASILETLQPIITGVVGKVKEFTNWFRNLNESQRQTIVVILGIVAAIAPVLLIFGKVCTAISSIINIVKLAQPAFAALNAVIAANPIILIIIAIVAFIAALVLLYNKCEWFREIVNGIFENIKEFVGVAVEAVGAFIQTVWTNIQSVWAFIQPYLQAAWETIKTIWDALLPYFQLIWDTLQEIFSVVATVIGGFFSAAWDIIKAIWDVVTAYFQLIWDTISGIFAVVKAVLSGDFQGAWDAIVGIFKGLGSFFQTAWDSVTRIFARVGTFFGDTFRTAWEGIQNIFANWGTFFGGLWESICTTFSTLGTKIGDAIGGAIKNGINGVIGSIEGIINGGIGLINGAIGLINNLPGVNVGKMGLLNLPRLAKGGVLSEGQAMVAEAGPELLQMVNGRAVVTPLTSSAKNNNINKLSGGQTNNQITLKIENFINNREQDIKQLTEEILEIAEDLREREEAAYG